MDESAWVTLLGAAAARCVPRIPWFEWTWQGVSLMACSSCLHVQLPAPGCSTSSLSHQLLGSCCIGCYGSQAGFMHHKLHGSVCGPMAVNGAKAVMHHGCAVCWCCNLWPHCDPCAVWRWRCPVLSGAGAGEQSVIRPCAVWRWRFISAGGLPMQSGQGHPAGRSCECPRAKKAGAGEELHKAHTKKQQRVDISLVSSTSPLHAVRADCERWLE
jgi:hypothetical protein